MTTVNLIKIVGEGLKALFAVAPDVAKVFTGGRPVDELIAEAEEAFQRLPVRTGDGGAWEADLEARKARGQP